MFKPAEDFKVLCLISFCDNHFVGSLTNANAPHIRLEWDTPMYRLAVSQLDRTAERMALDEDGVAIGLQFRQQAPCNR